MEGVSGSCKMIALVVRILKGERGITTTRGRATNYRPATVKFSRAILSYRFFDLTDPSRKLRLHKPRTLSFSRRHSKTKGNANQACFGNCENAQ